MKKLSLDFFPLKNFKQCQLCGAQKSDICEFIMWWECDEKDNVVPDDILITCKGKNCRKVIDDHERLYVEIPWSRGGPGKFILLCGECVYRNGTSCTHPSLKANGGNGLRVEFARLPTVRVCTSHGVSCFPLFPSPINKCDGLTGQEKLLSDVIES